MVHPQRKLGISVWDTLVRTAGFSPGALQDTTSLFTANGNRNEATTNLDYGVTVEQSAEGNWVNSEKPLLVIVASEATLSQAEQLDTGNGAARKVQRSGLRLSKPITSTSAQPCHSAGEDMIHAIGKLMDATCINGATLPSDQSHVVLALRVFTWFRNSIHRVSMTPSPEVVTNGDFESYGPWADADGECVGNAQGDVQDVYRLNWQVEEQLHWSFGTGLRSNDLGALAA